LADGCVLVQTTEAEAPFSFFKWVFVPNIEEGRGESSKIEVETGKAFAGRSRSPLPPSEKGYALQAMLAHERAHAHDWHSMDVLLVELLCVALWFHPLAHWYRRALRTVHEYLADAQASRLTDKQHYGLLLIRQAQSGVQLAFVNHFLQSPLKQRLVMLTRNASPAPRVWKYGLVLPVFTMLFLFACQKTTQEQADQKPAGEPAISAQTPANKDVFELFDVEQPPQFPGGQEALIKFLSENITYPEAAKRASAEGIVAIVFVVDRNGAVTDVTGIKSEQHGWRQDFQDEAIRVVQSMPNWKPAIGKGKPVKVKMTLPIRFKLK
jgi:TonB family protein